MSTTITAVIINLLVTILPFMGVEIKSEEVTNTIQTIVAIVTGVWIWYQRLQLRKTVPGASDVTLLGLRK